jgi:hypothetical protein
LDLARWFPFALHRQMFVFFIETGVPAVDSVDLVRDDTVERH